jgi:glycerol-3-phosphate dehydrogenase (NAD(P)+)
VPTPIAVIGAGSFGTALALLCAREHPVALWARDPDLAARIRATRRNPRYLSDLVLPDAVAATSDLAEALAARELVLLAVPSHGLRAVAAEVSRHLAGDAILVSVAKGIEEGTLLTMDRVLVQAVDPRHHARLCVLSGPSFAREIADRKPTVVTVACREEAYAIAVQTTLSCPWFRCYTSDDVTGVEVGGALKNVIAIAVGVCDGLGMGENARAALMTRGLAEVTRLGVALGANPLTFLGLSGMGDLVLTCTGGLSRNRRVGLELAKGRALAETLAGMREVAEGVRTTRAACALGARLGISLPIMEMTRSLLDGEIGPAEAGRALMTRQLGSELE